jgi:hypothetical protein
MDDVVYLSIVAGFGVLTWGLLIVCERLMGGGK